MAPPPNRVPKDRYTTHFVFNVTLSAGCHSLTHSVTDAARGVEDFGLAGALSDVKMLAVLRTGEVDSEEKAKKVIREVCGKENVREIATDGLKQRVKKGGDGTGA